mmetsp:Transcript_64405/g.167335  ORF Transcript_64405/g.167335 Transcript_64405/m.167335 type:complete len:247 (-) Transcript_64405:372-1112(-)
MVPADYVPSLAGGVAIPPTELRAAADAPALALPEEEALRELSSGGTPVEDMTVGQRALYQGEFTSKLNVYPAPDCQQRWRRRIYTAVGCSQEDCNVGIFFTRAATPSTYNPWTLHKVWLWHVPLCLCKDDTTPISNRWAQPVADDPHWTTNSSIDEQVLLPVHECWETTVIFQHLREDSIQSLIVTTPPTHHHSLPFEHTFHCWLSLLLWLGAGVVNNPRTWDLTRQRANIASARHTVVMDGICIC